MKTYTITMQGIARAFAMKLFVAILFYFGIFNIFALIFAKDNVYIPPANLLLLPIIGITNMVSFTILSAIMAIAIVLLFVDIRNKTRAENKGD